MNHLHETENMFIAGKSFKAINDYNESVFSTKDNVVIARYYVEMRGRLVGLSDKFVHSIESVILPPGTLEELKNLGNGHVSDLFTKIDTIECEISSLMSKVKELENMKRVMEIQVLKKYRSFSTSKLLFDYLKQLIISKKLIVIE
jgi:hypothetical protein